jgi:medium-chain acyl-[acyl-carrier-protein] hydrolase
MKIEDTIWKENAIIQPYQADFRGHWKPSSFLRAMQTAASHSAESLGFGYHNMLESGMAWVLSRLKIRFHAFPLIDDTVTIKTWPKKVERKIWFIRDFEMFAADGRPLAAATSTWLLIDVNNTRLMTEKNLPFTMPDNSNRDALAELPQKISLEANLQTQFSIIARYSDIDIMGHVNNARYADWVTDCFPIAMYRQKRLQSLQINFVKEVKPGDGISISMGEGNRHPGLWAINGDNLTNGEKAFEAAVLWSNSIA